MINTNVIVILDNESDMENIFVLKKDVLSKMIDECVYYSDIGMVDAGEQIIQIVNSTLESTLREVLVSGKKLDDLIAKDEPCNSYVKGTHTVLFFEVVNSTKQHPKFTSVVQSFINEIVTVGVKIIDIVKVSGANCSFKAVIDVPIAKDSK